MAVIIDINYREATESTQPTNYESGTKEKQQSQAKTNVGNTLGVVMATMVAKQTLNYATSNIGKWSGSTRLQSKVNDAKSLIGDVISIGGSIATGNPVIIATTLVSKTVETGFKIADKVWELNMEQKEVNRKLRRAGYNNSGELIGWRH